MEIFNKELLNFGAFFVFIMFAVREIFAWLKVRDTKKNGNGMKEVVAELKMMNENHLNSLCKEVMSGNKEIVEAINEGNIKIVELLSRIEGRLYK